MPISTKGQPGGVAELDGGGKVPTSQLPSSVFAGDASTTDKGVLKLTGDLGGTADLPTVPGLASKADASTVLVKTNNFSDLNNFTTARQNLGVAIGSDVQAWDAELDTWSTKTAPAGTVVGTSDAQTLTNKTLTSPVINNPTGITKGDVGLGNVDNTSDLSKPISTATQSALDLKANASDLTGKVSKTGDTMNGSLTMSGAATQVLFPDNATTSGGLSFGGDTTFARTNTGTLRMTAAAPILEFTSTNNTSGIRLNVTSAATTAYRVQYSGISLLTIMPAGTSIFSSSTTTPRTINTISPYLQVEGIDAAGSTSSITRNSNDANPAGLYLAKSRSTTAGGVTILQSGDTIGTINFLGADGVNTNSFAASIQAQVDGTPGAGDMPGRLVFYTTADGSSTATQRMLINNAGLVGIGVTPTANNGYLQLPSGTTLATGGVSWGTDTNLYRSAADTLKTDDNLIVAGAGSIAGSVVTVDGSQTLTNKRTTKRISSNTSSATPTPSADTDDVYLLTALAVGATFGAPTGTPTDGQSLIIRIKDNGTARSLAWNAAYRAIGVSLPTTTVINKTHYLGFIYNSADSKWDCLAVSQEA